MYLDGESGNQYFFGDSSSYEVVGDVLGDTNNVNEEIAPNGSDTDTATLEYRLPDRSDDNDVMGDTLTFDIKFILNQNACS